MIYEYRCEACGHVFEVDLPAFSPAKCWPPCPKCHAESKRVYGAPGVTFRGPGFYKTDARHDH